MVIPLFAVSACARLFEDNYGVSATEPKAYKIDAIFIIYFHDFFNIHYRTSFRKFFNVFFQCFVWGILIRKFLMENINWIFLRFISNSVICIISSNQLTYYEKYFLVLLNYWHSVYLIYDFGMVVLSFRHDHFFIKVFRRKFKNKQYSPLDNCIRRHNLYSSFY